MFNISDLNFSVSSANLDAYFDEDLMVINWGIEVSGSCTNLEFKRWNPKATVEVLLATKPGEITHWTSLTEKEISWETEYDNDGEPYGLLYVFEHCPISKSKIEFKFVDNKLELIWKAKADVNVNDKYNNNLDLEIRTDLVFKGIWCGKKTEKECFQLLRNFFDPNDFLYNKTEHGVSLLVPTE